MKLRYPTEAEAQKRMSELGAQREELYRQERELTNLLKDIEREYELCRKIMQHHKKEDDPHGSE